MSANEVWQQIKDEIVSIISSRSNNEHLVMLFLNLDRLRLLNDCFGHSVGDRVLQQFQDEMLKLSIQYNAKFYRYGGNDFLIYALTNDQNYHHQIGEQIIKRMTEMAIPLVDKYFDQVLGSGAGENVNLQKFNATYLKINDTGYTNPSESFDYRKVPAAHNTVTMSKLILLNPTEVNRLMSDLGSAARLQQGNIMLGFIGTLDGSNQWPNGMVIARDCNAYKQVFMKQPGENPCTGTPQPPTVQSLSWVAASAGQIPGGAVVGGQESGRSLFICRANHQNGVHPGKVVARNCNIGYGGKESEVRNYEVLVKN
jgi:diguanylate cyclase (GGDEF)-like protein